MTTETTYYAVQRNFRGIANDQTPFRWITEDQHSSQRHETLEAAQKVCGGVERNQWCDGARVIKVTVVRTEEIITA